MAKIKYTLEMDSAKSLKFIEDTAKKTFRMKGKLRDELQKGLVACAWHAWKHGDWTIIYKLCNPQNSQDNHDGNSKMVKWACRFLGLSVVETLEKDGKGKDKKVLKFGEWLGRDHIKEVFEQAKTTMWFSYAESKLQPWNINDVVRSMLKTRANKLKKLSEADCSDEFKKATVVDMEKAVLQSLLMAAGLEVDSKGNIVFETIKAPEKQAA